MAEPVTTDNATDLSECTCPLVNYTGKWSNVCVAEIAIFRKNFTISAIFAEFLYERIGTYTVLEISKHMSQFEFKLCVDKPCICQGVVNIIWLQINCNIRVPVYMKIVQW